MAKRATVMQLGYMQDCSRRDGAVGLFIFADDEACDPVFESLFAAWEEEDNGIGTRACLCVTAHIVHLMTIKQGAGQNRPAVLAAAEPFRSSPGFDGQYGQTDAGRSAGQSGQCGMHHGDDS